MFKALTPIIGIIVAVGLFFTYVRPTFDEVKIIQNEAAQYAEATEKASELQHRINELKQQQSSISLADLERIEAMLPDRVDEVAALIDIDALATLHGLALGDIKVTSEEEDETGEGSLSPAADEMDGRADPFGGAAAAFGENEAEQGQYSTLDINFSVTGVYDDFRMFLQDIERSLVLMEITEITFESSEGDTTPFTVGIRLYSLNPPTS